MSYGPDRRKLDIRGLVLLEQLVAFSDPRSWSPEFQNAAAYYQRALEMWS